MDWFFKATFKQTLEHYHMRHYKLINSPLNYVDFVYIDNIKSVITHKIHRKSLTVTAIYFIRLPSIMMKDDNVSCYD